MKRYGIAIGLAGLTACLSMQPSTQIESVWKDPPYKPSESKHALVIGVLPNPQSRRYFEEVFAKEIRKHGGAAECSYPLWSSLNGVTRKTVEDIVKEKNIDAVFITRVIDKKSIQTAVPPSQQEVPPNPLDGAVGYLSEGARDVSTPGQTVEQTVVVLETKLFETHQGKVVWLCRSETLIHGYVDELIRSYIKTLTTSLFS